MGYSKEEATKITASKIPLAILSAKADDYLGKNSRIGEIFNLKHYRNNVQAKPLKNANGDYIIEVKNSTLREEPNSITQVVRKEGGIDRNYYDENGYQVKQISNYGHGHPKEEAMGKHGEHAHDYKFNKEGKLERQLARELTYFERKENKDIL